MKIKETKIVNSIPCRLATRDNNEQAHGRVLSKNLQTVAMVTADFFLKQTFELEWKVSMKGICKIYLDLFCR